MAGEGEPEERGLRPLSVTFSFSNIIEIELENEPV